MRIIVQSIDSPPKRLIHLHESPLTFCLWESRHYILLNWGLLDMDYSWEHGRGVLFRLQQTYDRRHVRVPIEGRLSHMYVGLMT